MEQISSEEETRIHIRWTLFNFFEVVRLNSRSHCTEPGTISYVPEFQRRNIWRSTYRKTSYSCCTARSTSKIEDTMWNRVKRKFWSSIYAQEKNMIVDEIIHHDRHVWNVKVGSIKLFWRGSKITRMSQDIDDFILSEAGTSNIFSVIC